MSDHAISVSHVSMMFSINNDGIDSIKEYFVKAAGKNIKYSRFWALKDVSFNLEKGDRMGVLGFNGAGKSTLLKVIAGVLKPTMGTTSVKGVVAPLLELGAGFDSNYSGRENIYLYGATMGFSRRFIEEKFDEIVDFSELGSFIDTPLKSYSSGMRSRLGFAIATSVRPDVLILDEVLSVGDAAFRAKSEKRLISMMSDGVTVLFVSHSTDRLERICNKGIILNAGQLAACGDAEHIGELYREMVRQK